MPKLDKRLQAVAQQIRSITHVDIGSDHGHLLAALLHCGRIQRGIAIENKQQPFENSRQTLSGLNAEVRFGNALAVLKRNEADSLSMCGLGGRTIASLLAAHPERLPPQLVLQPNRRSDLIRRWAIGQRYALVSERLLSGHPTFEVLTFQATDQPVDPAYRDVDFEAAIWFGPLNIKQRHPDFVAHLQQQCEYLKRFERLSDHSRDRLALVQSVLQVRRG